MKIDRNPCLAVLAATLTLAASPMAVLAQSAPRIIVPDASKVLAPPTAPANVSPQPTGTQTIELPDAAPDAPHLRFTAVRVAGATVVGVTGGNTDRLADFSKEHCAGQFPVAAAPAAIIKAYDVAMPAKAEMSNRTSYVIGKNGKIIGVHSEMSPLGHISSTLAVLQAAKR